MVLAQIFDVMLPDKHTLLAEVKGEKAELIKIFEARNKKDVEKAMMARTAAGLVKEASAEAELSLNDLI